MYLTQEPVGIKEWIMHKPTYLVLKFNFFNIFLIRIKAVNTRPLGHWDFDSMSWTNYPQKIKV